MSVEEFSLNITLLSKYAPYLVANPWDEISRLLTGVYNFVNEECDTTIHHSDMTLSRIMVYAQYIEESKPCRRGRYFKRWWTDEKCQPKFKKRAPSKEVPSAPKANNERGVCSQTYKPTCSNYGNKLFGKCLASTSGCFCKGMNDHKVRGRPTMASWQSEAKKISLLWDGCLWTKEELLLLPPS